MSICSPERNKTKQKKLIVTIIIIYNKTTEITIERMNEAETKTNDFSLYINEFNGTKKKKKWNSLNE